jgi:hypothetical protein
MRKLAVMEEGFLLLAEVMGSPPSAVAMVSLPLAAQERVQELPGTT